MPTLRLWWRSITLAQKRFHLHKTGRHHSDFCLTTIPQLKLDSPQLCDINKHFPWLCMWSMVLHPLCAGWITVSVCKGRVNQVVSTLHILRVLNQKNSMQIMGLRQGSNPPCSTMCSRGKKVYVTFPSSVNTSTGCPSPVHLSCVNGISNASTYWENEVLQDGNICLQTADRQDQHMGLKG